VSAPSNVGSESEHWKNLAFHDPSNVHLLVGVASKKQTTFCIALSVSDVMRYALVLTLAGRIEFDETLLIVAV
jgi:hypothetical protein